MDLIRSCPSDRPHLRHDLGSRPGRDGGGADGPDGHPADGGVAIRARPADGPDGHPVWPSGPSAGRGVGVGDDEDHGVLQHAVAPITHVGGSADTCEITGCCSTP